MAPAPQTFAFRGPLQRSREGGWLMGVCAGIGAFLGIGPGWVRLAFVAGLLAGGVSVLLYALAWIVLPLEPERGGETEAPGARSLAARLAIAGLVPVALLLFADTATMRLGGFVVLAPAAIAVAGAIVRRGSLPARALLLATGIALTSLLGWLNYQPTFGDRRIDGDPQRLASGVTHLFGTLTIDLTSLDASASGEWTIDARIVGGDVVLRVPQVASLEVDQRILWGTSGQEASAEEPKLLHVRLNVDGLLGSVRVEHVR